MMRILMIASMAVTAGALAAWVVIGGLRVWRERRSIRKLLGRVYDTPP
jgi:hypothetical protein